MGETLKLKGGFDRFEEAWFAQLEPNQNIVNVMIHMRYDNPNMF